MFLSGGLSGLSGYDRTKPLVADYQIQEGLESLIRASAIRVIRDTKRGLSGLEHVSTVRELDDVINDAIMTEALDGLAYGGVSPMTAREFDRKLIAELSGGGLGFIHKKLKRAVKKVVRSPKKLARKLKKGVSKVARKLKPFVKKYGAAIAAVVALYYGGPSAMAAVKKAWSKYQAKKAAAAVDGGVMGPPPPEGYGEDVFGPPAPPGFGVSAMGGIADNPEAIEKGAMILKKQMEKSGTPMNSPGAWDFLKGVVKGQLKKRQMKMRRDQAMIQQQVTGGYGLPPRGAASNMLPLLAVGAGAIFMMTKG